MSEPSVSEPRTLVTAKATFDMLLELPECPTSRGDSLAWEAWRDQVESLIRDCIESGGVAIAELLFWQAYEEKEIA